MFHSRASEQALFERFWARRPRRYNQVAICLGSRSRALAIVAYPAYPARKKKMERKKINSFAHSHQEKHDGAKAKGLDPQHTFVPAVFTEYGRCGEQFEGWIEWLAQDAARRAEHAHRLPGGTTAERYERTLVARWKTHFSVTLAKSMVKIIYSAVDAVPA